MQSVQDDDCLTLFPGTRVQGIIVLGFVQHVRDLRWKLGQPQDADK